MRHLVLGTAGHIDHGKTTLVRALTGVDTDRLPEEKRRGITIDLGFARLPLPDVEYAVVDVPGHESLVRNMLAGATGIDVVLLVIAADEGIMPQTREHLAIMQLLHVRRAVVALTKADLVDPEWLELVREDVQAALADTPFAGAPILPVSGSTGAGVDTVRAALARAAADCPERDTDDLFRLPVDRVFTVRGTGTVATGSVWSGRVARDASVRALPGGVPLRARGLQHHGAPADSAAAGERIALALATDRAALERGVTLTDYPHWDAATLLTVQLHVLADAPPVRPRQRVRVHLGTQEVLARVAVPGGADVVSGTQAWVQLRLEQPLVARARDRFVLRSYSPVHTIAGGVVAEPAAPRRKRLSPPTVAALTTIIDGEDPVGAAVLLAGPEGLARSALPIVTGLPPAMIRLPDDVYAAGDRLHTAAAAAAARRAILAATATAHRERPLEAGATREELRRAADGVPAALADAVLRDAVEEGALAARGACFALPAFRPELAGEAAALAAELVTVLRTSGLAAPRLSELPDGLRSQPALAAVARLLAEQGTLVALAHDHYADAGAVLEAVSALRSQVAEQQPVSTGTLKQVVGLSRKYLIPLLEYLDRVGVTARSGEDRILLPERDGR